MESKEYFEKVMQDYNQNRKGRSLRKYCKDEAVEVMGGLSSTRRTILYRRNTRNHRKMLSYKLSQLLRWYGCSIGGLLLLDNACRESYTIEKHALLVFISAFLSPYVELFNIN